MEEILKRLRYAGWAVAVHNDYFLEGAFRTFWLLTHRDGTYVKGEGQTDKDALVIIERQIAVRFNTSPVVDG